MDAHTHIDNLIDRARALLGFLSEDETVWILVDTGAVAEDAWLAVKAAAILNQA